MNTTDQKFYKRVGSKTYNVTYMLLKNVDTGSVAYFPEKTFKELFIKITDHNKEAVSLLYGS